MTDRDGSAGSERETAAGASAPSAAGSSQAEFFSRVHELTRAPSLGRLGPYELIEEISRGGQGVVYRAYEPVTRRQIALKRLLAGSLASDAARARFQREVEAAATLDHPNIVTVYGFEILDGHPMLAMQWVDGVPIDAWAAGGAPDRSPPTIAQRLRLFLRVCDAVQHAHQRGVIHRDLKPGNILVSEDTPERRDDAQRSGPTGGGSGIGWRDGECAASPKVLDFGLAKLTGRESDANLTLSGEFLGTPAYAAPEQASGAAHRVDTRTDQYALGVILYQMLTGVTPHGNHASLADLLYAIRHTPAKPPSSRNRRLPRDLDAVVLKTLEKDPARRYPSLDALSADVRRFLTGEAVLAVPPSRLYRLGKLIGRHRAAFALGAAALLGVCASAVTAIVYAVRFAQQRSAAVEARDAEALARSRAQRDSRIAAAVNRVLVEMLSSEEGWNARVGKPARDVLVSEALVLAAESLDAGTLRDDPDAEAAVRETIGSALAGLARYDEAVGQWERGVALRRASATTTPQELIRALRCLANALGYAGRTEEAYAYFDEALQLARQRLGPADAAVAEVLYQSAYHLTLADCLDEAEERIHAALDIARVGAETHPRLLGAVLNIQASIHFKRSQFVEADVAQTEALARIEAADPPPHPNVVAALSNLGKTRLYLGDAAGAYDLLWRAREMHELTVGVAPHPELAKTISLMAAVAMLTGDLDEAEERIRESHRMYALTLGEENEQTRRVQNVILAIEEHRRQAGPSAP